MKAHPKLQQFLTGPLLAVVSTRETPIPGVEVTTHFPRPVAFTKSGKPRDRFPSESITVTFEVRHSDAPALVAAIEEIRNEIGERLSAPHKFSKEDALTRAAAALSSLHAGVTAAGYTTADPEYR